MKFLHLLFLGILCAFGFPAFSQLAIGTVDSGPYTPGSTIAATFSIDANTCIKPGNVFSLRLSDDSGNFTPGTVIGSYNSFYSTFVNGTIPAGTPAGTGYKVRIESSNTPLISSESAVFTIKTGIPVIANIESNKTLSTTQDAFGFCNALTGSAANIILGNKSTPTAIVNATFKNELNNTSSTSPIISNFTFTPDKAHYTLFVKAVMPDGSVGTKAYFIINNDAVTAFSTRGNNVVCLPGGALTYFVDVSQGSGIQNNFPGNTYRINWGDKKENIYTFCDLKSGTVSHEYEASSCGQTFSSGNTTIYNAFGINVQVVSPYCGDVGTGISTTAKVVTVTQNIFQAPALGCTVPEMEFVNTSILGDDPTNTGPSCKSEAAVFTWFLDGVAVEFNKPKSFIYKVLLTPGVHTIRLESTSATGCGSIGYEQEICIQAPPVPLFTVPNTAICAPNSITPTNTSTVDEACASTITYQWTVTPSVGVTNPVVNSISKVAPTFNFTQAGIYTIGLRISTVNCGVSAQYTQQVIVNNLREVTLAPDVTLCTPGTFNFNTTAPSTKTTYTGNETILDDTYLWTVTSTTGGTYSFVTPATSKYPSIKFDNFGTYTITSSVTNVCGTRSDSQEITFTASPVPDVIATKNPICYTEIADLQGSITNGSFTNFQWIGAGTFSVGTTLTSDPADLKTNYTPTNAERITGSAIVILRVNTGLTNCPVVERSFTINILPNNTQTNKVQKICTGLNASYTPTSSVAASTFTWVATNPDGFASGFSVSGSGPINEIITNNDLTNNAIVIYTITPKSSDCDGIPFTFTVTITPKPTLAATASKPTICSEQLTNITLATNVSTNKFIWTSTVTGAITGNTQNATGSNLTIINDKLINNGTTQGTATYIITPVSDNACLGTPTTITITVEPQPTIPNAGQDENICLASSYMLKGNQIITGSGLWTEVTSFGAIFTDATLNTTEVTNLKAGNSYIFRWTVTGAPACTPISDEVTITVNALSVGGTTTGSASVCTGSSNGQITLAGNVGNVIRWESSTDNGVTYPTVINNITTTLNYTNITTTTYYRAVVQSGVCVPAFSTPAIITVNAGTTAANAGPDQTLCNTTSTMLAANTAPNNSGLWTVVPANASITFADATQNNTTVSGLVGGQSYTFRWTITGLAPCNPSSDDVVINNLSALQNNIIATQITTNCTGQTITLTGALPTGGNGIYTYVWQTSATGNAPWTTIAGQTGSNLNVTVTASQFYQRTVNSGVCSTVSNVINIIALPPIANNIISADQVICSSNKPNAIVGSAPTGGDGTNYTYSWEQSINNGVTWSVIPNELAANYSPTTVTQTTLYRRLVSSGVCSGSLQNISAPVKITVILNAKAEFTYVNDTGCIPFVLDANNIKAVAYPTRNASYNWYADNVLIGSGINFPAYSITTANTNVIIKLVVTSSLNCLPDEMSHTFSTRQNIIASYTQSTTSGCGPLAVTFNNTTTSLTGVSFQWAIDNNNVSTAANPGTLVFLADPAGEDKIYDVSLKVTTPCGSTIATSTVTVKANPIAAFLPSKTIGCSPFTVVFTNTSPGSSNTYSYDFDDGTTSPATTNKGTITHTFTTDVVRDFEVKMTATNECGTDTKPIVIRVSPNSITPALIVNGNQMRGCAPFTVNFINNTKGASKFTYTFEPGVIVTSNTFLPETRPYTFNKAGTYTVNLLAENNCSTASTQVTIVVDPQPTVAFKASNIVGCKGLSVKFENTTTDAVSYSWNFGDGTTSAEKNPTHIYNAPAGTYTVSLTAVNSLGCPQTLSMANYIKIVAPPIADFNIAPAAVISIPEYTFKFTDVSTNGAQTYKWSFGDGDVSTVKDPTHKYADTGKYLVTMRTFNEFGCVDSIQKSVQIVGVPGYVYVPNSFIPGGTSSPLQKFTAVASGIKTWKMQVINKWGQVIWETSLLNDGKPVEGWDGTYKGVPQPQGIYFWKLEVELINGTEWKGMTLNNKAPRRTGEIYLIR